ncbi:DUF1810 domain-containing protein [Sphingobacterium paludis]|uniref:Uncharacterized protein (DUF1810 family) n=1 Tax=Sphingobacterium paludis TaxID=1476465 RepID=A0A4R7CRF2_9SPHI|nr:DUF1810 domain-containing protein [Sphingobacterium paludis]TDS08958.1 uncharacterized protein (DUF1810 family) [Sphingobacterium paludis]
MEYDLQRFLNAQNQAYLTALYEIKNGKKESHWIWFIFPQIQGLGQSENAQFYIMKNLEEAEQYLAHPILGENLIEITRELLLIEGKTALEVLGWPDNLKLQSSMTLFAKASGNHPIFQQVLDRYFEGKMDMQTLKLIES